MRRVQDFAGRHRHRSCTAYGLREYPCRRVGQGAIGARLAKIGRKVPGYALDRVRTQESLEPD